MEAPRRSPNICIASAAPAGGQGLNLNFLLDLAPRGSLSKDGFSHLKAERQTPDKISMRSANLEKQLWHKHRGRVYLEMRWVRLAELHSPAFNAQPTFLTAGVFFRLRFIFNAALHLFTWQAPSKWAVNPSSISSLVGLLGEPDWVCFHCWWKWKDLGGQRSSGCRRSEQPGEGTEYEFSQSTDTFFFLHVYLIFLWWSNLAKSALSARKAHRKVSKTRQTSQEMIAFQMWNYFSRYCPVGQPGTTN